MSWLPFAFGFPAVLWGLLALPVIWWLLRLTPPKPQTEVFPPLQDSRPRAEARGDAASEPLVADAAASADGRADVIWRWPNRSWNPREQAADRWCALALVIDNGWASAPDWERRVATAERADRRRAMRPSVPVILALTAEKPNAEIGPFDAAAARDKLRAAEPRPIAADRPGVFARTAAALETLPGATVALLADGIAAQGDEAAFRRSWAQRRELRVDRARAAGDMVGLTAAENEVDGFALKAVRAGDPAPAQLPAGAFDDKGRRIADATIEFRPWRSDRTGTMAVPFELRNDFASIAHRRRAAGRRDPCARRQFQAPPRRPAVAGGSRPGAAVAFAALLHPQRARSLSPISSNRRARISPWPSRTSRPEAGDDRAWPTSANSRRDHG